MICSYTFTAPFKFIDKSHLRVRTLKPLKIWKVVTKYEHGLFKDYAYYYGVESSLTKYNAFNGGDYLQYSICKTEVMPFVKDFKYGILEIPMQFNRIPTLQSLVYKVMNVKFRDTKKTFIKNDPGYWKLKDNKIEYYDRKGTLTFESTILCFESVMFPIGDYYVGGVEVTILSESGVWECCKNIRYMKLKRYIKCLLDSSRDMEDFADKLGSYILKAKQFNIDTLSSLNGNKDLPVLDSEYQRSRVINEFGNTKLPDN